MNETPIPLAYGEAIEKFLRHFGDGPHEGLKTIGDPTGKGWAMTLNPTKEKIDNVPPFSLIPYLNGWPAGIIDPGGGCMVASMEGSGTEEDFIAWCREDAPTTAS